MFGVHVYILHIVTMSFHRVHAAAAVGMLLWQSVFAWEKMRDLTLVTPELL